MTDPADPRPPSDDLDDLVSAHLDGATTPDEAALVEADPAAQARLVELRRVRDAVRTPPPVDGAAREAAVAAALAAFDLDEGDERDRAPVTSLAEVAARRSAAPRALRLVGIAAAVLLLAALVPLLAQLGTDDQDDLAGSSAEAFSESADATRVDGQDDAGDAAAGATAPPEAAGGEDAADAEAFSDLAGLDDLGTFADLDDLLAAVRDQPTAPTTTGAVAPDPVTELRAAAPCSADLLDGSVAEPPITVRRAMLAGRPVLVVVSGPVTTRTISVIAEDPCELVAQVPAER